jgi:D-alanyl-D-alanine carboxypeptidase
MSEKRGLSGSAMGRLRFIGASILAAALVLGLPGGRMAEARPGDGATYVSGPVFAWILLDAGTGQVLGEQNADMLTYPASLTKMMTLYLTFEALNQGRIRLDQLLTVSAAAASRSPSKLGLTPGETIPLRDLILGVITRSANDAASVIAENLAGSEANFARYMTWKARQLGMQNSWYQNASGLPDPGQRTTARDIARLSLALYHDFPREYRYFSIQEFYFRGEQINTHNHLLEVYPGADGIKTGFVNASGFNIATSAVRNGHRLIGVIMGGRSAHSRDLQMASLLDQGFAALGNRQPATPAQTLVAAAPTSYPKAASSSSIPAATVPATTPARAAPALAARVITAPVITAAQEEEDDDDNEADTDDRKADTLSRVASAALRHLAPVSKAQAAPAVHVKTEAEDSWGIQLGAYRDQSAARQALHRLAGIAVVNGKPQQVLAPPKSDRRGLYRVRLLRFNESGARAACTALKKRQIECTVVRSAMKVASS